MDNYKPERAARAPARRAGCGCRRCHTGGGTNSGGTGSGTGGAVLPQQLTGTGYLRLRGYTASNAFPVTDVSVHIVQRTNGSDFPVNITVNTGSEGVSEDVPIPCPSREYSLDENNTTVLPYSVVDLSATREGFYPVRVDGVQIFDTVVALQEFAMIPIEENGDIAPIEDNTTVFDVPEHSLFAGDGGSGPLPIENCPDTQVLDQVIIPDKITVHLGKPSASARDVTVSFRDYIKNVASCEIYPTCVE